MVLDMQLNPNNSCALNTLPVNAGILHKPTFNIVQTDDCFSFKINLKYSIQEVFIKNTCKLITDNVVVYFNGGMKLNICEDNPTKKEESLRLYTYKDVLFDNIILPTDTPELIDGRKSNVFIY